MNIKPLSAKTAEGGFGFCGGCIIFICRGGYYPPVCHPERSEGSPCLHSLLSAASPIIPMRFLVILFLGMTGGDVGIAPPTSQSRYIYVGADAHIGPKNTIKPNGRGWNPSPTSPYSLPCVKWGVSFASFSHSLPLRQGEVSPQVTEGIVLYVTVLFYVWADIIRLFCCCKPAGYVLHKISNNKQIRLYAKGFY